MIEVRIRHVDESAAVWFCTWPVRKIDDLIPSIQRWGLSYDGNSDVVLWGQFVATPTEAFFELIVEDNA